MSYSAEGAVLLMLCDELLQCLLLGTTHTLAQTHIGLHQPEEPPFLKGGFERRSLFPLWRDFGLLNRNDTVAKLRRELTLQSERPRAAL